MGIENYNSGLFCTILADCISGHLEILDHFERALLLKNKQTKNFEIVAKTLPLVIGYFQLLFHTALLTPLQHRHFNPQTCFVLTESKSVSNIKLGELYADVR